MLILAVQFWTHYIQRGLHTWVSKRGTLLWLFICYCLV